MKRVIGFVLAALMLCSIFGAPVYAANTTTYSSANAVDGVWTVDYTGEAYVKISLVANSDVTVTITASDGKYDGSGSAKASYTKALSVSTADSYYFGSYTFKPGDTVAVSNPDAIASQGMELVPTEAVYLDTTMIDITGWAGSGLYNFNDSKTYYTSGADVTATWDIPDTLSSVSDIYYFFPENGGKSDSSLTFELKDIQGNTTTWSYGGDNMAPGWHKVSYADFSETKYETISVKKGSGTYARLTGFKFVEKKDPYQSFLVTSDNLLSVGAWERVYEGSSIHLRYKDYLLKSSAASTNPALGSYNLPNGTYNLYVHSADFSTSQGTRTFHFKANNSNIYKKYTAGWWGTLGEEITYFGTHGEITDSSGEGWKWEKSETPITITNGHLELKAYTDAANARFDAVLISNDPFISLDQDTAGYDDSSVTSAADTACYLKKVSAYENDIAFPSEYKEAHTSTSSTATLSNEHTTVTFNLGTLSDGTTQSVQRKTEVGGVETVGYDDGFGFLVLYADSATKLSEDYYPRFNTSYTYSDDEGSMTIKVNTGNVFEAGQPEWLIPTTLTQVDANTVTMTASGTLADITATWTLAEGDKEPKVSVTATTKKAGEYSFGFFNNVDEISRAEVGYVLNPYRWQESRYPDRGILVPEAFSTTNHTQMTYKPNSSGQEITLGVAVDESIVTKGHWTHMAATQTKKDFNEQDMTLDYTEGQSKFGMNTTGNQGGALPAVFAPLMGSETSTFTSGQTFEFAYRPLSTVSTSKENTGWYDCYSHVVKDLRGVYDYRDNYFASMTDTVFNILDLMKDDSLSGWSNDMLAHYYTEETNSVEVSDALVYLQNYLLTDDKDLLMKRTLPSMAYMLTRNKSGFIEEYSNGGATEGPINKELTYSDAFPNSTFEGAYLLSRGRMPVFRNIAKKKQIFLNVDTRAQGLPNPSQALWYDIANGDENLTNAVSYADNYINNRTFDSSDYSTDVGSFVNTDYYPHFQSQLEMYEATGEQKYLDGAIESARRALPVMRATDMPTSKEEMYTPDVDLILKENEWVTKRTWFYDDTGYRRGATLENISAAESDAEGAVFQRKEVTGYTDDAILVDDTPFPFWVASRVGLSLEQATTCSTQNQSILMSTWAGELLRLGYLSNDQLMMDMARSSLVGRSSNYPGYYIANYYTTYGQEDYPKKGFDSTQLYFTHIPPYLAALQDYLFSNAWVKSDGKIDFPYVRSQGYVWFNTRQYGYEPGSMYDEQDMWPWLKEGTITLSGTDAKQIDWIAGRKDGRAAFALTNASDTAQTVTINFNSDLGITSGSTATIYDQAGNKTTGTVNYDRLEVTVPAKGILTVAVDGSGITIPEYAKGSAFQLDTDDMGESALGLMYEGNTYEPSYNTTTLTTKGYSTETGYDVKAYALALDDTAYMGYIFVGGRSADARLSSKTQQAIGDGEKGITQSVLSWHYEGEEENVTQVTDTTFPFEFLIPVTEDPTKKIVFNVATTFGDGTEKTLANDATIAPVVAEQEPEDEGDHFVQSNFEDFTPTTWYFGSSYLEIDFGIEKNPGFLENYFFPTDTTGDGKPDEMRALGIDGALTGTAGSPNIYCEFISEVAFKLTFKGKEIVVPVYGARPTSDKKDVCLSVDLNSFNEAYVAAGGEAYASKSALSSDWNATNITSVKFTPNTVNMGAFPDGTVFISALKAAGSDMATTGDNYVKMMQNKDQEFSYTFGVTTAGEYNAYVLTYDAAGGGRRGKVLVNGAVCDFTNDTVAPASLDTFWANAGTVTLNAGANILTIPAYAGGNGNTRFGGVALVPKTAKFKMTLEKSLALAEKDGIVDGREEQSNFIRTLSKLTDLTTTEPNYADVKFGSFPKGSVFISAAKAANGNTNGMSGDDDVKMIHKNTIEYNYPFAIANSGTYDVYCLNYDDAGNTNRGGIVYVNGKACDYKTDTTYGPTSIAPFWKPAGEVTLNASGNILNIPVNAGGTADTRFGGIVFVPKEAEFNLEIEESIVLGAYATGVVDGRTSPGKVLSVATELTTHTPSYDEETVNVTVNGTAVTVVAGTAQKAGMARKIFNTDGSFINSATVLDALAAAGISTKSGTFQNAVLVDGKNVYPDRTLVYSGMKIETIDGASVDKTNFAPVLRNDIVGTDRFNESTQLNGQGFQFLTNTTKLANELPFNDLADCFFNGYFSVTTLGSSSLAQPVAVGSKVYFLGDKLEATGTTGRFTTVGENATKGNSTEATAVVKNVKGDGYVVNPFYFLHQQGPADGSGYYDCSEAFIANTSATDEVTANKIKDGKWQLLTTGTSPCQVMIVDVNSGVVKSILRDQIITGIAPLTITLEEGEKAFVWKSRPYSGPSSIFQSGIYLMKPLCSVLTY